MTSAGELQRSLLITDRHPGPAARVRRRGAWCVVPVAADGSYGVSLAEAWQGAGYEVVESFSRTGVDSATVRALFTVEEIDDAYRIINLQREAVLAPEWPQLLAWLPSVSSDHDSILVDVRPDWLGAVEASVAPECRRVVRSVRRHAPLRYSLPWFVLGEWLAKGVCAPRARMVRRDVIFYAELANHWRQLAPIAAALRERGLRLGFAAAAVASRKPFIPEVFAGGAYGPTASLDRSAISPPLALEIFSAIANVPPSVVRGALSAEARAALAARALHCRRVYEKFRVVSRDIACSVLVMGDGSSHRPAALIHAFERRGVPTVVVQHGMVADVVRYLTPAQHFLAWDSQSERAVLDAGIASRTRVVGIPSLDIAVREMDRHNGSVGGGILLAPTYGSEAAISEWIALALRTIEEVGWGNATIVVRLHPQTDPTVVGRIAASIGRAELSREPDLTRDLLNTDIVVTDGSSVGVEALAAGLRVFSLSDQGALVPQDGVRQAAGAAGIAADAIIEAIGAHNAC